MLLYGRNAHPQLQQLLLSQCLWEDSRLATQKRRIYELMLLSISVIRDKVHHTTTGGIPAFHNKKGLCSCNLKLKEDITK